MTGQPSEFLDEAVPLVRQAGELALHAFRYSTILRAKEGGDLVTEADVAVEKHILDALAERFPQHGFLSEERGEKSPDAEYVWILDPIDGTRHFSSGVPLFSISLALYHQGRTILGIVFNPVTGELFTSALGAGATLNGHPIRVSELNDLSTANVCVEIPNRHFSRPTRDFALAHVTTLVDHVERVRCIGVSALGLCYCASGGFDAYLNLSTGSKEWDLAAGLCILREAGGVFTKLADNIIVGGPQRLHDQLFDLLGLDRNATG